MEIYADVFQCLSICRICMSDSIVEKLVIIMQYLQDEALTIDKTIRISKDALSCLTMSEYSGNLAHQRSEIRQACASGYQRYIEEKFYVYRHRSG